MTLIGNRTERTDFLITFIRLPWLPHHSATDRGRLAINQEYLRHGVEVVPGLIGSSSKLVLIVREWPVRPPHPKRFDSRSHDKVSSASRQVRANSCRYLASPGADSHRQQSTESL